MQAYSKVVKSEEVESRGEHGEKKCLICKYEISQRRKMVKSKPGKRRGCKERRGGGYEGIGDQSKV